MLLFFSSSSSSFRFVLVVYSATVEKPNSIVGTREKHTQTEKTGAMIMACLNRIFLLSKESNSGTSFDVSKKWGPVCGIMILF
jgi:hypothetical protein